MLLMIDNYDSFTYKRTQCFGRLGEKVEIYRNTEIVVADIVDKRPNRLVVSPELEVSTTTDDGEIMGIKHKKYACLYTD